MTERRKQRFILLLPVLVCFIGMMTLSDFWIYKYQQSNFKHISKFCEIIIKNNPEIETQVLSAMKEYRTFTE